MRQREDLTGKRFGKLTVSGLSTKKSAKNKNLSFWDCICECGEKTTVETYSLKYGKTSSCGCKRRKNGVTLGRSGKGTSKSKPITSRSNTGYKGITKLYTGHYIVYITINGRQKQLGKYTDLTVARKKLIEYEKRYQMFDITKGKYDSVCAYSLCKNPFNKNTIDHQYCSPLCRSKAHKERRREQTELMFCPQCGGDWEEPKPSGTGKQPKHCKKCQEYFRKRYENKNRVSSRRIDLTGQVFGELKVIRLSDELHGFRINPWECLCSCGNHTYVPAGNLRKGHYKSCGCKQGEKRDAGVAAHIERDKVNGTRISALKAKLHKDNKSGVKGVRWNEERHKWNAYIGFRGKQITLGYFLFKEDAVKARLAAEEKYHIPVLEGNNAEQ